MLDINSDMPVKTNKLMLFLFILILSQGAFSQGRARDATDSIVSGILQHLNDHEEIDRDIAIKYLQLDSILVKPENAMIHGDSTFSFGSHVFWIVSYAGMVNCTFRQLIEYIKGPRSFKNWMELASSCDFDLSGDHTTQTNFKIRGDILYVYDKYYKIENEDLLLVKKQSTYSAFRFPEMTVMFERKPLQ